MPCRTTAQPTISPTPASAICVKRSVATNGSGTWPRAVGGSNENSTGIGLIEARRAATKVSTPISATTAPVKSMQTEAINNARLERPQASAAFQSSAPSPPRAGTGAMS